MADETNDDAVELDISEEILAFIIIKAREFDVKVEPVDPDSGSNSTDEGSRDIIEDMEGDTTQEELKDAIDGLDDDAKLDLVALVWLGRGDYEGADWPEARSQARETQGTSGTAEYLMGIPQLGDLLEEGYAALGYSISDVETDHL